MYLNMINYLNNMDKNSRFLLIIIGVIVFLLILIFIINYLGDRKVRLQRSNRKKLIAEVNKEAMKIKEIPKKVVQKQEPAPAVQTISANEIEKPKEEEEEIIEVLQEDNESDVDRILREIKEASKEETINLNEFEKEQEETAIISYDELCKRAGVKKKIYKAATEEVQKEVETIVNNSDDKKKYKPSTFVSPIFGIQDKQVEEDDLDKTFLQNLKEFRSTLDM